MECPTTECPKIKEIRREKEIKAAHRDFPDLPRLYIEWMWDVLDKMPKEEQDEIISKGLWEGPGKFTPAPSPTISSSLS